jgi:hypothetical protein
VKSGRCSCGAVAVVFDTRRDIAVCRKHRLWQCEGCGGEHAHDELRTYSDDFDYYVACPNGHFILQMDFWERKSPLPEDTAYEEACWTCYGSGRCACVGTSLGPHERCLKCDGSNKCGRCRGTGLKAKPAPPG